MINHASTRIPMTGPRKIANSNLVTPLIGYDKISPVLLLRIIINHGPDAAWDRIY
jgi:hypothetical protein